MILRIHRTFSRPPFSTYSVWRGIPLFKSPVLSSDCYTTGLVLEMLPKEEIRRIQALTSIDRNFYQKQMLDAVAAETEGVSYQDLYEKSGTTSEDRFDLHLEVLQSLGVVTPEEPYKLTPFGKQILGQLEALHR